MKTTKYNGVTINVWATAKAIDEFKVTLVRGHAVEYYTTKAKDENDATKQAKRLLAAK